MLATRNSSNEFWKIVKKATKIHPIKPNINPVELNEFFNELLNRDVTTDQHHHLLVSNFMKHHDNLCNQCNDNLPGILNDFFLEKEIHDCIQKLANKKATGIDGLISEMFKCSSETITPILTVLLIRYYRKNVFHNYSVKL